MRVFLTGGTGVIGRRLGRALIGRGDIPVILTRRADQARLKPVFKGAEVVQGDPAVTGGWDVAVDGCDAVINLVGHNIFAERWSPDVKRKIRDSRLRGTENIVGAIARAASRPRVLVQASAIGYYGPCGDDELPESAPAGNDFMAEVCRDWESAAQAVNALGVREARIRTGVVLARGEGALGVMTPLFKLGPGVPIGGKRIGKGKQWMSWIHLDDIVGIFLLALDRSDASGAINGTAPNPVRNAEFARELSRTLWRPYAFQRIYLPLGPPDFALKLALGEVATVVTTGQRVLPEKAKALGYAFRFPHLASALADLFPRTKPTAAKKPEPALTGATG
jgi:uncharacterized protein